MTLSSIRSKCPGLYCGRQLLENVSMPWNVECGACPRGYRVNMMHEYSACERCENNPSAYDWLYLGFMAMLPLILHWFFIDLAAKERWLVFILHFRNSIPIDSNLYVFFRSHLASQREKSFCMSAHSLK